MGCKEGRFRKDKWAGFNFFGHQLVCHFTHKDYVVQDFCNHVDIFDVPVPHYGLALTVEQWKELRDRLK